MGVKAAGGVRTHEEMLEMVKRGATRIGTSSGAVTIQRQFKVVKKWKNFLLIFTLR